MHTCIHTYRGIAWSVPARAKHAGDGVDASGHGLGMPSPAATRPGSCTQHTHTRRSKSETCERLRCVSRLVSIPKRGQRKERTRERTPDATTRGHQGRKEGRKDPRPTLRPRPVTHVWSMASWATGAHPTQRTNTRHIHMPSAICLACDPGRHTGQDVLLPQEPRHVSFHSPRPCLISMAR